MNVWDRVRDHYREAKTLFPEDQIVCLGLQGSQNYKLDTEKSDVDTKLLVTPTLNELVRNTSPVSNTHVRENNEHIDCKDVRLYIDLFKHQNPNFIELLFSDWLFINPTYNTQFRQLINMREDIAHMNMYRATHAMFGMMNEKYHAMEHPYPSKLELIKRYGYDGKQLSHLLRMEEFLQRYLRGISYKSCLIPTDTKYLIAVKENAFPLSTARKLAVAALEHGRELLHRAEERYQNEDDPKMVELLDEVQYEILKTSLQEEMK